MFGVFLVVLYSVLLAVLGVGAWRLRFAFTHFRAQSIILKPEAVDALPSVTVCIPARNEYHALSDCLERVIASTYPKLEIIVLDDMSGDKTPALIKSFASEGVRFVEGTRLREGWLGKNHALQELLDEASGTYVLFLSVDTRVSPDSIEKLVTYAQSEQASMVSVMPRRDDGWRTSVIFSTLRYFWEVMFHRRASPATASNAWMIDRKMLVNRWEGFTAFKSAIQPESQLSAALMQTHQYRFVMGAESLGISYEKKWQTQIETSIRLLYPLLGAKIAHSIVALLDMLIVLTPFLVVLSGFIIGWNVHHIIAGVFWLLFSALYGTYLKAIWKKGWWLAALLWPFVLIQEMIALLISTERYTRNMVKWKGRSVKL
ncbi:MAG: glycosyltransferase family 2 protein [Candidatus Saccharimonadales bacterium]